MTETEKIEKPIEVPGKINFGLGQLNNPTPLRIIKVSKFIRYVGVGGITLVTASSGSIFNQHTALIICFCLSVGILLTGGIEAMYGVDNETKN